MTLIKGRVERVSEFKGQYGSMFNLTVNGERYGSGKTAQGASEGDYVEFSAMKNAKGYWDVEKGTLKPAEAPADTSKIKQTTLDLPTTAAPPYVDTRQDSIIYQSSRKDALEFVGTLLQHNMVDFGKSKGADKIAIVETFVDKFTEHFVSECKQLKPSQSQGAKESGVTLGLDERGENGEPY